MCDAETTAHNALLAGTKHGSEGDTGQVVWGTAGAARRRSSGLPGEPRRPAAEEAGEGAASDARVAWEGAEGGGTHLPPHVQLELGQAVALVSNRSTSAAATASPDLRMWASREHECRREHGQQAGTWWRARCVGQCVASPTCKRSDVLNVRGRRGVPGAVLGGLESMTCSPAAQQPAKSRERAAAVAGHRGRPSRRARRA